MTTYQYETHHHLGDGTLQAESDQLALAKLKEKFGEELHDLICVSVEESEFHSRTVWIKNNT